MNTYRNRIYEKYVSMFKESKKNFDRDSAFRWGLPYKYYFRNWLPYEKTASILDIACGDGKLLYFYSNCGYKCVQGIDISHEQVNIAKQVCPNVHVGAVQDFLYVHPETYDLISGIDFIEHLYKHEVLDLLDSCYTALKPQGRIILQSPNSDSPMSNSVHHADFTHEVQLSPVSLSHLLRLSGFDKIEIRETGPVFIGCGIGSFFRYLAWQVIRIGIMLYNIVETGGVGSRAYTRVIVVSGIKQ